MRWTPGDRSNIEDMRGRSGIGMRAGGLGIGGVLVLLLLSWATGVDFLSLLGGGGRWRSARGNSWHVRDRGEHSRGRKARRLCRRGDEGLADDVARPAR
jgi:predicted metalloprotease